jgi:hypothetical protein
MCGVLADVADLPIASASDDPIDHLLNAYCPRCNRVIDASCPDCGHAVEASGAEEKEANDSKSEARRELLAAYRRLLLMLVGARNTKFTLQCYLLATGSGFAEGRSMTEVACEWGVKKATVSKQCRAICAHLGIEPSRYMRKEETAQKFRLANRRPRRV